jgi:hypothetical protein
MNHELSGFDPLPYAPGNVILEEIDCEEDSVREAMSLQIIHELPTPRCYKRTQ